MKTAQTRSPFAILVIEQGKIDSIEVYKVDRLSRSHSDFAKFMELFDKCSVLFASVTQQFNTTNSMGRLTLNMPQSDQCSIKELAKSIHKGKTLYLQTTKSSMSFTNHSQTKH